MRVDVRSIDHLGNNIFDCSRSKKAHVHLELILEKAVRWDTTKHEAHFTHMQNLQRLVNTLLSVGRKCIQEWSPDANCTLLSNLPPRNQRN